MVALFDGSGDRVHTGLEPPTLAQTPPPPQPSPQLRAEPPLGFRVPAQQQAYSRVCRQ